MNNKNIRIALAMSCVLGVAVFFIASSKKNDQPLPVSAVVPPENISTTTQQKEPTWKEYYNTEYGYTVSYTDDLHVVETEHSATGQDSAGFGWFYIEATTTKQTIQEMIDAKNKLSDVDRYVIDNETMVSGYPAVITHVQNIHESTVNGVNTTMFVKKGDTLLSFYVRGDEKNNATFIKSVRFDK